MTEQLLDILHSPELLRLGIATERTYAANEAIVTEGADDRRVFLIDAGRVRVTGRVTLDEGRHIQPGLCDLDPGEVFGELSLFEGGARSASVIALEEARVRVFDAPRLAAWFDEHPERGYVVLKALFGVLTARLRKADERLSSLFAWGLKVHGIDKHL
ncbi:MAG: cyclic nucleotide-binding domain-containing protein [Gammaproteobacteria bacterium]